jgi:hypothetical protein
MWWISPGENFINLPPKKASPNWGRKHISNIGNVLSYFLNCNSKLHFPASIDLVKKSKQILPIENIIMMQVDVNGDFDHFNTGNYGCDTI